MATKKKKKTESLPSQEDPGAPLNAKEFLAAAQRTLQELSADLLERADRSHAVTQGLKARWEAERAARRTGDEYVVWRRGFVVQVGAAWILSLVFVRTLEDRGLLERNRIAGLGAADSLWQFLNLAPHLTEREYLLTVFRELTRLPAARELFDARHNPVWMLGPSAEMAKKLLSLFRAPSVDAPSLRFGQTDTRFLGDLYQDLSTEVRERFALLQTPNFVEEYILDRTLERAIERFGLDETTLIDPTCGSGHFLLGAFQRLVDHRLRKEPGLDVREAARRALDAVYGADINPYAVAIARFRLTLAFLDKAGYTRLSDAPELPLHLVVADSLLHNPQHVQAKLGEVVGQSISAWSGDEFALDDESAARDVLRRRFAAVVGNPPYITPKDSILRKRYAEMYPSCHMNYALTVPFTERFFQLARVGGYVGKITANSFMKREFGKKLVESFLPTVNIDGVVNTSGAYIPGHGTPTVLLFGSNESQQGTDVLTVLAMRGEPSTPEEPEQGYVWQSIAVHGANVGFDNDYISVARIARTTLAKHPWSLGGGGAMELKELLEARCTHRLTDIIDDLGFSIIVGEDEVFLRPAGALRTNHLPRIPIVIGELVRDWSVSIAEDILRPFAHETLDVTETPELIRELWPWKTILENRVVSGSTTMKQSHREWYDVRRLSRDKHRVKMSIVFAFVATHNHFVLDRGGKVFNRSAPIIKLKEGATEEDHLALLAYLNSSTACFWMKQVMSPKGMHNGSESNATPFLVRFEFDGTKMGRLPLPTNYDQYRAQLASLSRRIGDLQLERTNANASAIVGEDDIGAAWDRAIAVRNKVLGQLIALQEEIDWVVYAACNFTKGVIGPASTSLRLGERPFEVCIARSTDDVERQWFRWHESTPNDSPCDESVAKRVAALEASDELCLLECPEAKRRWVQPSGKAAQHLETNETTLRDELGSWLRDQIETRLSSSKHVWSTRDAKRVLDAQTALTAVASLVSCDPIDTLIEDAVPFLAADRHTLSGLEKRAEWERIWELQRAEERGEDVAPFGPPPKYDQTDYREPTFWRQRGKLDVPKERYISYPRCESDEDKAPVYGWAGWNHLEQAQALAALYMKRKTDEGWGRDRLLPMLAGIAELIPWVKQWHNEPSAEFGGMRLGDYFADFIANECRTLGATLDDLRTVGRDGPPGGTSARKKKTKATPAPKEDDNA